MLCSCLHIGCLALLEVAATSSASTAPFPTSLHAPKAVGKLRFASLLAKTQQGTVFLLRHLPNSSVKEAAPLPAVRKFSEPRGGTLRRLQTRSLNSTHTHTSSTGIRAQFRIRCRTLCATSAVTSAAGVWSRQLTEQGNWGEVGPVRGPSLCRPPSQPWWLPPFYENG